MGQLSRAGFGLLLVSIGVAAVPTAAWADTFGAYCVSPNYIAYQSRQGCPGNNCRTYLAVLPLGGRVLESTELPIEAFTVHTMKCNSNSVAITGPVGSEEQLHQVYLNDGLRPVEYRVNVIPKPNFPFEGPPTLGRVSLSVAAWRVWEKLPGSWTTTERVPLLTDERGHRYVLEVVAMFPKKHACASVGLRNRIVEIDSEGRDVHSLVVFSGRDELECGE